MFVTDKEDLVPGIISKITHTEMVEDMGVWAQDRPLMFRGNHHINIFLSADSLDELEFKRKMVYDSVQEYVDSKDAGFMIVGLDMKADFLDSPQKSGIAFADVRKGGGFLYAGPIIPL